MSLLVAILLAAVTADGATTWLSTFTGSARADYAVGPSAVSGTAEILPEGAIRFAADTWLEVRGGPDVLPREAGTVEFRLRPEWDARQAGAVPILRYGDAAIAVEPDGRLRATGFASRDTESPAREWIRGEWFDIAVSWGPAGLVVLVDGAEAARGEGPSPIPGEAGTFRFGGGAYAVDDLRVSDAPRRSAPFKPVAGTPRPAFAEPKAATDGPRRVRHEHQTTGLTVVAKHYAAPVDPAQWLEPMKTVRLFAARGETEPAGILIGTSFPLADIRVAAEVPGIAVTVKDPDGPPLPATFRLGASECVELVLSFTVPADAAPGIRTGEVLVTASGASEVLRIELEVLPFALPGTGGRRLGMLVDPARLVEPDRLAADFAALATFHFDAAVADARGDVLRRLRDLATRAGFTGPVEPLDPAKTVSQPNLARDGEATPEDWFCPDPGADLRKAAGRVLQESRAKGFLARPESLGPRAATLLAEGLDDGRYNRLLATLVEEKASVWPEAAEQARRSLRSGFDRRRYADEIRFLLVPGSLRITARGPDGKPRPFVLVTATGLRGTPVASLYDFRVDLDTDGNGEVPGIPARRGSYSVRLHTEREFRSAEGFDLVWVGDVTLRPGETTTIDATLVPGGRVRVASPFAADIRIVREGQGAVAATFWRGDAGGFTTQAFRLTPGFLSCPLPPGPYRAELRGPRLILRGDADFVIRAGEVTEVALTPRR